MDEDESVPEGFDLGEALHIIDEAEVLVIGFGWLKERLLVDSRRRMRQGPYIRMVGPVANPQERMRQLQEWRPGFPDPESFVFLPWSGRVEAFRESALAQRILQRNGDDAKARADYARAIRTLHALDREDLRQAIFGGEKYHTLYNRPEADA